LKEIGFERRPEFFGSGSRPDAIPMGRFRLCGFRRDMDGERDIERRHGDVRHRIGLVDDQPQRQSA
jgi:hypothetical protein